MPGGALHHIDERPSWGWRMAKIFSRTVKLGVPTPPSCSTASG